MTTVTMAGRGRGWGKNGREVNHGIRRPGKQTSSVVTEGDDWFERISKLDINDRESITSPCSPIANLIKLEASDEEQEHLVKMLNAALDDRTFALKLIKIFENDTNSRSTFMRCLQKIYYKQDKLYPNDPVRFSNMVYIFSEVYHRLRKGRGELSFLRDPLQMFYRKLLHLGGEDDIELLLTQLALNGRDLSDYFENPEGVGDIFLYAREILATRDLSTRSRVMLLLMIDLHQRKFMPLSGTLQKFYADQLGQATLLQMQGDNVGLLTISTPESQDDATDKGAPKPGILMTIPPTTTSKPPRYNKVDTKFSPRDEPSEQTTSSAPRAIRGSGSKPDYSKVITETHGKVATHKFDEGSDCRALYNEWVNQSYGHDDRFSTDY